MVSWQNIGRRECVAEEAAHLKAGRKQRQGCGRGWGQDIPPRAWPQCLPPPTRSHLWKLPPSPNNAIKLWSHLNGLTQWWSQSPMIQSLSQSLTSEQAALGTKPLTHEPSRDTSHPSHNGDKTAWWHPSHYVMHECTGTQCITKVAC
jgi:hypothetical protein